MKTLNAKKIPKNVLIKLMKLRLKNIKYEKPTKVVLEKIIFNIKTKLEIDY